MPSKDSPLFALASWKSAFALGFGVAVAIAFAACSPEGNGDRCDSQAGNGGNSDCSSGLVCTHVGSDGTTPVYACCPAPGNTDPPQGLCVVPTSTNIDSGLPPATGDAAADAESATDAGSDAATEAGTSSDASNAG